MKFSIFPLFFGVALSLSACFADPNAVTLQDIPPFPNEAPPQEIYSERVKEIEQFGEELKAETEAVRAAQDGEADYYGQSNPPNVK